MCRSQMLSSWCIDMRQFPAGDMSHSKTMTVGNGCATADHIIPAADSELRQLLDLLVEWCSQQSISTPSWSLGCRKAFWNSHPMDFCQLTSSSSPHQGSKYGCSLHSASPQFCTFSGFVQGLSAGRINNRSPSTCSPAHHPTKGCQLSSQNWRFTDCHHHCSECYCPALSQGHITIITQDRYYPAWNQFTSVPEVTMMARNGFWLAIPVKKCLETPATFPRNGLPEATPFPNQHYRCLQGRFVIEKCMQLLDASP